MPWLVTLSETEKLRCALGGGSGSCRNIDLIDIPAARLALRAVIAEEGVLLKGGDTLLLESFSVAHLG